MNQHESSAPISLPPSVRLEAGAGGLPRLEIASRHGRAELYFQGAHLTAWHPAGAEQPVLWLSAESRFEPGKAIRGGVPICFPWFGANAADPSAPAHGFARTRDWTLIDVQEDTDNVVTLVLELAGSDFRARYHVTVGPSLTLALEVHNPGSAPFRYEEALHSYFSVSDIHQVTITGVEQVDYLDKVANFARRNQGGDPVRFSGETDRVYLNTRASCQIHDTGLRRIITIHKRDSDDTVIWNPWIDKARAMADFGDDEWSRMVCVETCNVNDHAQTLAPGASHTMTAIIDVAPAGPTTPAA
jgi:glucose-6-phosphate 1-epimerase